MKVSAARDELAQYVRHHTYDCPGGQWGYRVDGQWYPGWRAGEQTELLQYCLWGPVWPSARAYAAAATWTATVVSSLRQPRAAWWTVRAPRPTAPPISHADIYTLLKTDGKAYKAFRKALKEAA